MSSYGSISNWTLEQEAKFNTTLPTSNTAIFTENFEPEKEIEWLSIYVCFSVSGILRVTRTVGTTTVNEDLYGGSVLTANSAYVFALPVASGQAVNFIYSATGGTIKSFIVSAHRGVV